METVTSEPSKHTGRPFGLANLPEETKASIVAAKNLQVFSHQRIAQDHNVSRQTVVNITEDKLKPETKLLLESFTDKLGSARVKIIDRIHEKLDNNDFKDGVYPNLLNAVNNNFRLETQQATSIVDVRSDAINALIAKGIVANIEDAKALLNTVVDGELIEGETD